EQNNTNKWHLKPLVLQDLKENLSKWQTQLNGNGWNSLYWNNHDQPRIVSRFGDDKNYPVESAKMLGTLLHMMQGTPYIYQGEEIGMTNVRFNSIEKYKDIETLNMYRENIKENQENIHELMESIYAKSRDNARTPMQWDDSENAGFSKGKSWIDVNLNYPDINVEKALKDQDSVFYYYKKLIELRKKHEIIVYGSYELILKDHESIFAYTRNLEDKKLLVICNFTGMPAGFDLPDNIVYKSSKLLISNYGAENTEIEKFELKPYEARVYLLNQ
ncbi:MAG: alpha-amylase family glycosyl hydrolase, partial [Clostridiaceae bacterium]